MFVNLGLMGNSIQAWGSIYLPLLLNCKKLVEKENDPVEIKSLAKKIKNFDMVLGNSKVNGVLQKGLLERSNRILLYSQNSWPQETMSL